MTDPEYCTLCGFHLDRCDCSDNKPATPDPVKFDTDKPSLDLLPFSALVEVGKVLSFGAAKYASNNWRSGNGLAWSRLLAAAPGKQMPQSSGEDKDGETGLSHLAHAAACVLFLLAYSVDGGGRDDRWVK